MQWEGSVQLMPSELRDINAHWQDRGPSWTMRRIARRRHMVRMAVGGLSRCASLWSDAVDRVIAPRAGPRMPSAFMFCSQATHDSPLCTSSTMTPLTMVRSQPVGAKGSLASCFRQPARSLVQATGLPGRVYNPPRRPGELNLRAPVSGRREEL
jgi:hypothetical protein